MKKLVLYPPKGTGCLRDSAVQFVIQFAVVRDETAKVFERRCLFYRGVVDGDIKGRLLFARPAENLRLVCINLEAKSGVDFRSCTQSLLESISSVAHECAVISVL